MRCVRIIIILAGILGVCGVGSATADVTSVSSLPAKANVALSKNANLSVIWNITSNAAAPVTVTSAAAEFRAGGPTGPVLGTVKKSLHKTTNAAPAKLKISEHIQVPGHIIKRAHKQGHSKIVYLRTFSDGGVSNTGVHSLYITSSAAAKFNIHRLSLRFDDESTERHVHEGDIVHVLATINYSGSGLLQAVWEISEPLTGSSKTSYRALKLVRRRLAGSGRLILASPELATVRQGIYQVRLRLSQPSTADMLPVLRYIVAMPAE